MPNTMPNTPTTSLDGFYEQQQDVAPRMLYSDVVRGGRLCPFSASNTVVTSDLSPTLAVPPLSPILDIHDAFNQEYSPSRPGYVFSGDWEDFCNFDIYAEGAEPSASVNCVDSFPSHDSSLPGSHSDPWSYSPEPEALFPEEHDPLQDFLANQKFIDWYLDAVQSGFFDSASYADGPVDCVAPDQLQGPSKLYVEGGNDDPPATRAVAPFVRGNNYSDSTPAVETVPTSIINVDSDDIDDLHGLVAAADDNDSEDNVTDDSSDDDDLYLEPGTVLRHYWFRYDIKYVVLVNGRKYFLTAEQLEEDFGNVSYSLWHYWNKKRAGRTPYARIIDYLRYMGHYGFFREMVFHLAPSWLRRMLYAAQKNGTLKYLVIPDEAPKKPKRK